MKFTITCQVYPTSIVSMGFKEKLESLDVKAKDIPKAIIIHELLGLTMLALTWSAAYHLQLSRQPFFAEKLTKLTNMLPEKMKTVTIPFVPADILSSRMGSSYIEASCMRKLIRPITLPGKLIVTFKLINLLNKKSSIEVPLKLQSTDALSTVKSLFTTSPSVVTHSFI